jgi:hypothetical protein
MASKLNSSRSNGLLAVWNARSSSISHLKRSASTLYMQSSSIDIYLVYTKSPRFCMNSQHNERKLRLCIFHSQTLKYHIRFSLVEDSYKITNLFKSIGRIEWGRTGSSVKVLATNTKIHDENWNLSQALENTDEGELCMSDLEKACNFQTAKAAAATHMLTRTWP